MSEVLSRHEIGHPNSLKTRLNGMDWYQGGSPWHQNHLVGNRSNGVWAIDVVQSGRYRFELRWFPRESPRAIGAIGATVRVGSISATQTMSVEDSRAVIELDLVRGEFDMSTDFQLPAMDDDTRSWGAYYVYVDYLGQSR